ncbi:ArnT family glycosyltransferase [Arsenicicoccus bolidensis]|uniref:Glycosyltransferase family 39 protein n=1 Tax=Arsenicicoccus bolidensis TaxID=229480 RepID=A0ABS9Q6V3_9MICO|nr:glycosyltransferase family 39 protein [Arsenicicoccus bolidensis]MCG7323560.1 glycosyltransferase family 39 protein [Arsenicicoccus bolidensis]
MTVQTWRPVLSRGPMPPVVRVVCGVLLAGWTLLRVRGQGPGNPFYAASAWSATKDAQAWFFGSVDPQSTITIDKPPLLIWVLGASCRLFGFSAASLVLTQTAIGVCATVLVYLIGRRVTGWVPASIGAGVFLLTPVNALVFGYTNPDVELTALACAALYAAVRAVQERSTWWTAAVGASLGLAFLTKMLQGLVIVPALTVGLFLALPGLRARLYAIGAAAAGAAAPVVLYLLGWSVPWPHRPYIGGSPNDSFLGLVLGYNGLSRVVGRSAPVVTAPVATAPTPPASSAVPTMDIGPGVAGPARLLLGEFGQEVGAAVLLGVVCLAVLASPRVGRAGVATRARCCFWPPARPGSCPTEPFCPGCAASSTRTTPPC